MRNDDERVLQLLNFILTQNRLKVKELKQLYAVLEGNENSIKTPEPRIW